MMWRRATSVHLWPTSWGYSASDTLTRTPLDVTELLHRRVWSIAGMERRQGVLAYYTPKSAPLLFASSRTEVRVETSPNPRFTPRPAMG